MSEGVIPAVVGAVGTIAGKVIDNAKAAAENQSRVDAAKQLVMDSLDRMKQDYGHGVSTQLALQNAGCAAMSLVHAEDFHGHADRFPPPPTIGPGQIGCFLHVHTAGAAVGSSGLLVYRTKNTAGAMVDVLFAWDTPWAGSKKVFTAITPYDTAVAIDQWKMLYSFELIKTVLSAGNATSSTTTPGLIASASMAQGSTSRCTFGIGC